MNKHPLELLSESKGMNGYQFNNWIEERTNEELHELMSVAKNLKISLDDELKVRGLLKVR